MFSPIKSILHLQHPHKMMRMDQSQAIKDIDTQYPVENLKVNGKQFWPFFKIFFFDSLIPKGSTKSTFGLEDKISFVFQAFYGFKNWFKRADYIVFSNSDQRRDMDGFMVDKSADYIHDHFNKTLHVELPVYKHFPIAQLRHKQIVSNLPLRFLGAFLEKAWLSRWKFEGLELMANLCGEYGVKENPEAYGKRFYVQYRILKWFFKWKKPRAVFMTVPYMKMGGVLAANELGIPVIEMQHGLVPKTHFGYMNYKTYSDPLYPTYFLSYGQNTKDLFQNGNVTFLYDNIFPIGHYYLSYIRDRGLKASPVSNELNEVDVRVAVSLIDTKYSDYMVDMLKEVAQKRPNWKFVFVPRKTPIEEYKSRGLSDNIIFAPDLNVYEVIQYCNIHTTVNSTCAIESAFIGVPNVLCDVEGKSYASLGSLLTDPAVSRFVTTADEYIAEIEKNTFPVKKEIQQSIQDVISGNFTHDLRESLNKIMTNEGIIMER